MAENFNVSIPFIQLVRCLKRHFCCLNNIQVEIRVRESRFGRALVLNTTVSSGGYVLGFRVDPSEKLVDLVQEIKSLHQVFSEAPLLGIRHHIEEKVGMWISSTGFYEVTLI